MKVQDNDRGCVLFAFNNDSINYVNLANSSARNIKRHLNLPTTLITDCEIDFDHNFDNVIVVEKPSFGIRKFSDYKDRIKWHNLNRYKVYELSPYQHTLLLDVDYIVSSNRLSELFKLNKSFLCHSTAFDITGKTFKTSNYFGLLKFPMDWATVICFKKDKKAENIFNTMRMVQENYNHYANLYQFKKQPYRNDFALSIAINLNSGHFINSNEYYIPWNLASVVPEDKIVKTDQDSYEVTYTTYHNTQKLYNRIVVKDRDLHVMGKSYLEKIYED